MDYLTTPRAQGIASAFHGQSIAFVPVYHDHEFSDGKTHAGLGVAVANDRGYCPVPLFYFKAETYDAAQAKADLLNADVLKLDSETVMAITTSTMGGQRFYAPEDAA